MALATATQRLTESPPQAMPRPIRFPADWWWRRPWDASGACFRLSIWARLSSTMPSEPPKPRLLPHLHFFPGLLVLGAVLATLNRGEFTCARSPMLWARFCRSSSTVLAYLRGSAISRWVCRHHVIVTIWSASGVIISWMGRFSPAPTFPRLGHSPGAAISISLVLMAAYRDVLNHSGCLRSRIETRVCF